MKQILEVFFIFLQLGCTSFGGPVAHLGYFQEEFVRRKKWLNEESYTEIISLCQFLPGPASSQVGMTIGYLRGGLFGAVFAWVGFTLPSTILMILFGYGVVNFSEQIHSGFLHGFKIAAVAVVAQALWQMGSKLCPDKERVSIAVTTVIIINLFSGVWSQILVILIGGIFGHLYFPKEEVKRNNPVLKISTGSIICILLFILILLSLPVLVNLYQSEALKLFDSFFRAGSLVFGGGHVVLPLLKEEIVGKGWVTNETFLVGYGAAQAIPGPLFSFSSFLGSVSNLSITGWKGGLFCLTATFLPSFLLVLGIYPLWKTVREYSFLHNTMKGINAAVVGLLLSAFYNPIWTNAIFNGRDFALALLLFMLLVFWKIPSWVIVIISALVGYFI